MVEPSQFIWKNGELIPWGDAQLHLLSTAVQFGASVFEGIRAYSTPEGTAILMLRQHLKRLMDSARIYRMDIDRSVEEIAHACFQVIAANGFDACYIRPMVLRGFGGLAMDGEGSPVEVYVPVWRWGAYLGEQSASQGIDVCVSSWTRPAPNTMPCLAKAAGNYNNAALIKMDAQAKGFAEAIALGPDGLVSEGSGQNVFIVSDGRLITPPLNGTILGGITRSCVVALARELEVETVEQQIPREMLYTADEVFLTGTASEIVPVRSVDRIDVGSGRCGPITRELIEMFQAIVSGSIPDRHGWLTFEEDLKQWNMAA